MGKIYILHVVGMMDFGGTEALLMNLLKTVDRSQFQFDFVEQVQEECAYDSTILSLGSKIYRCPHMSLNNLKSYRLWWRTFFAEHQEYQIVHGHSPGSGPIYMAEAKRAGRIVIAHGHSSSNGKGFESIIRYFWQLPIRHLGDYNFACSNDAGVLEFGKHANFTMIQNGIPVSKFRWDSEERKRVRQLLGLTEHDIVIGNVARFEQPKNHLFLVRVFYELYLLEPRVKLLLVGSGSLEDDIKGLIRQLSLDNEVLFAGNHKDVYRYYQAMDCFVLPSIYEGLPLVTIEAQASGLPCFVSDKVVAPECKVTELLHFIPLENSPEQWARFILETVKSDYQREDHSEKIREAGFDIMTVTEFLCDFYRKALQEHGKS